MTTTVGLRRAVETPEERDGRLHQMCVHQQQRLAAETPEERDARLHQLSAGTQQRLAAETLEERIARLQQVSTCRQQRIASETPQVTAARRQRDGECHVQQSLHLSSAQPLLHQPAVRSKMSKFHSRMAALQVATCVTSLAWVPWHDCQNYLCWHGVHTLHKRQTHPQGLLLLKQPASWPCTTGIDGTKFLITSAKLQLLLLYLFTSAKLITVI